MWNLLFFIVLLAAPPLPESDPLHFVAEMRGAHVAPEAVETAAVGRATGVLEGHRFTINGSFAGLSSPLRDIEKTPQDPGVHLHRGAAGETTHYFFGLPVKLNADERSGTFSATTELTDDQRALLLSGRLYIDIHTVKHGPGEVRDQWRAATAKTAVRALAAQQQRVPDVHATPCHAPADAGDPRS